MQQRKGRRREDLQDIHDHLSKLQCSLPRQLALSNRLSDHTKTEIIEQMQHTYPP